MPPRFAAGSGNASQLMGAAAEVQFEDPAAMAEFATGSQKVAAATAENQPTGELRIHNVLALATLEMDRKINLDEVVQLFVNASFAPDGFPAVRVEVKGPLTGSVYTISVFDGGRIQSAGGCMPREAGICMKKVAKRIRDKLGLSMQFKNFEIHNLLGVVALGCHIDLPRLFSMAPGTKDYEPSKFPALRVTLPVPERAFSSEAISSSNLTAVGEATGKGEMSQRSAARQAARLQQEKHKKKETVTASIFGNGKINFVGGKSVASIVTIIDELRPYIEACTPME